MTSKFNKTILVSMALSTLTAFSAHAGSVNTDVKDLGKKAQVSNHCAKQMIDQTQAQCNKESLAAEGNRREHACIYSYELTGITMAHPNEGKLEVVYTTGDSDEWGYIVSVTDEADAYDCTFIIDSENGH